MDYKNIINLIKEMNQTELTRLEIEEEGLRICIEKEAPGLRYLNQADLQSIEFSQSTPQTIENRAFSKEENKLQDRDAQSGEQEIRQLVSPMVGTFYAQSSPDKPPFVKVGDKVKKGQTVCIIEAMKLMNEIESEHDGEIVRILTQNEEMVEYGQPLFLIK